jgi:hypothetical protein
MVERTAHLVLGSTVPGNGSAGLVTLCVTRMSNHPWTRKESPHAPPLPLAEFQGTSADGRGAAGKPVAPDLPCRIVGANASGRGDQDLGSQVYAGNQQLYILSGADAIPPAITNVRMLMSGGKVTGISMTFSKAMNPASVQDVHSYLLTPNNSMSMSRLRTFLATGSLGSNPDRPKSSSIGSSRVSAIPS